MSIPTAAIVIIGNEILSGSVVDKNIPYLAKKLFALGIRVKHVHVIGDTTETIIETVLHCHKLYTYVFTTGGIGPTHDDITADAIAKAFQVPLEVNKKAKALLEKHYGADNLNEGRLRMARIPEGASLIENPSSTAPGFKLHNVFVLPGVPEIMQAMLDGIANTLIPGPPIYSETIQCFIGESIIALELEKIQVNFPEVEIGSYPYFKQKTYGLCLVIRGTDESLVKAASDSIKILIQQKGGTL